MKFKHFLALLLALILTFSLLACDKGDENTPADSDTGIATPEDNNVEETTPAEETTPEEEETTAEPAPVIEDKTYNFKDILDRVKVLGRTTTLADGISFDHTASTVEFNAYVEGSIKVKLSISKGGSDSVSDSCYFTLYVDGVKSETRLMASSGVDTTLELGSFAEGGVHNFRLVKQTEAKNSLCLLKTVAFKGYFAEKPADAKHYIEFLGDSITVGYGNLIANGGSNPGMAVNQDATQAFAYLTAERVKADYSMVAVSGIGVSKGYRQMVMKSYYDASSYYRSTSVKYEPTRIPDVVVINLGTNDQNNGVKIDEWQAAVDALVKQVRAKYGKDVPIVWIFNMMTAGGFYEQYAQKALNALGGEPAGLYICELIRNNQGGQNHPNLSAHSTAALQLASFMEQKQLLK